MSSARGSSACAAAIKVKCHPVFGLVALKVDQMLSVTNFRPALT
jgi:hypothetical protein